MTELTTTSRECLLFYYLADTDPPRVRECPESFTTRLNPGQSAKAVTWTEPHFSDNVRIASVKKSHEPGTIMTLGEHLISYEAKDASDNTARCSFTVTLLPRKGIPHVSQSSSRSRWLTVFSLRKEGLKRGREKKSLL